MQWFCNKKTIYIIEYQYFIKINDAPNNAPTRWFYMHNLIPLEMQKPPKSVI